MAAAAAEAMSSANTDIPEDKGRPAPPLLNWEQIMASDKTSAKAGGGGGGGGRQLNLTPKQYRAGVEANETYIHHGQVSYTDPQTKQMTTVILLLTKSAWYLFNAKTDAKLERNHISQVASVELEPETGRPAFKILQRVTEAGISKTKNWMGMKKETEIVTETLTPRQFTCASEQQADEWIVAIQHCSQAAWQRFFETTFMTSDYEIYQFHTFLTKINRHQRKQIRIIAVSSRRILNLAPDVFRATGQASVKNVLAQLKKVKWEAPLDTLEKIEIDPKDPSGFYLNLTKSATSRQKKNQLKSFSLLAQNKDAASFIVDSIRHLKEQLEKEK